MDEVDGMSGGDRGGVNDLIQSIHRSKVPIICICNDKYNQKLRSLRNHTLELDYRSGPFSCACAWLSSYLHLMLMILQCTGNKVLSAAVDGVAGLA